MKKALLLQLMFLATLPGIAIAAETYVVQRGDSLWKIAAENKAPGVTVHQMIAAIHEKNSAVLGADIGNIHPGMELLIPTEAFASNASSKDAEVLLGGSGSPASTSTRNARIDSIQRQIGVIEKQIDETIEAMQASQEGFGTMINH